VAAGHALTYGHLLGEVVRRVDVHATSTAIAEFYAAILDGRLPALAIPQHMGPDLFLEREVTWGQGGLGGNAGWADPVRGLAIAYVTRRLDDFDTVDRIESALKPSSRPDRDRSSGSRKREQGGGDEGATAGPGWCPLSS
jgi:CubicO group peptidase (beta-lactamase class C family)